MSETEGLRGRCLCGAVTFAARPTKREADACHCSYCRRWAGGPLIVVEVSSLSFDGTSEPSVYRSSDWGERLFCPGCGSNLVWRMQDGSFVCVQPYAFDPPLDLPLATEIFVDEQPTGYAFAGDARRMTGAEVAAMFAEGKGSDAS